ncbi:MAG: hypothetical protein ACRC46_00265 [Thermoguttaceae bacterium]
MLGYLKEWVCRDLPKPVSREKRLRDQDGIVRQIVANLSRGNVSLQSGNYITEAQLDAMREENRRYIFPEE